MNGLVEYCKNNERTEVMPRPEEFDEDRSASPESEEP